jgi:hypothetical protein
MPYDTFGEWTDPTNADRGADARAAVFTFGALIIGRVAGPDRVAAITLMTTFARVSLSAYAAVIGTDPIWCQEPGAAPAPQATAEEIAAWQLARDELADVVASFSADVRHYLDSIELDYTPTAGGVEPPASHLYYDEGCYAAALFLALRVYLDRQGLDFDELAERGVRYYAEESAAATGDREAVSFTRYADRFDRASAADLTRAAARLTATDPTDQ